MEVGSCLRVNGDEISRNSGFLPVMGHEKSPHFIRPSLRHSWNPNLLCIQNSVRLF